MTACAKEIPLASPSARLSPRLAWLLAGALLVAMVVFVNFVVDVLYAVIDPRLKPSDA